MKKSTVRDILELPPAPTHGILPPAPTADPAAVMSLVSEIDSAASRADAALQQLKLIVKTRNLIKDRRRTHRRDKVLQAALDCYDQQLDQMTTAIQQEADKWLASGERSQKRLKRMRGGAGTPTRATKRRQSSMDFELPPPKRQR